MFVAGHSGYPSAHYNASGLQPAEYRPEPVYGLNPAVAHYAPPAHDPYARPDPAGYGAGYPPVLGHAEANYPPGAYDPYGRPHTGPVYPR